MGGVHWGVAILRGDPTMEQLGKSMTPSLLVLVAVLIGGSPGLILLAAGFGALLYVDQLETAAGRLPDWYPSLRRPLSAIVITSLVIGAVVPSL